MGVGKIQRNVENCWFPQNPFQEFFSRCEKFRASTGFTRFWLPQVCFTGMEELTLQTLSLCRASTWGGPGRNELPIYWWESATDTAEKKSPVEKEKNSDIFNSKLILDWIFNPKFLQHKLKLLMAIPWRRSCLQQIQQLRHKFSAITENLKNSQ